MEVVERKASGEKAPASGSVGEFGRYALGFALGRAKVAAVLGASLFGVRMSGNDLLFYLPLASHAHAAVTRALRAGPTQACAALRSIALGSNADHAVLGVDPYSGGAYGGAAAITDAILFGGATGLAMARGAIHAARSQSELSIIAIGMRKAWVVSGTAQGKSNRETAEVWDAGQREEMRDMGVPERQALLCGAVGLLPDWAKAVERVGPGRAKSVEVLCWDMFAIDECEPADFLLQQLSWALERCPASVVEMIAHAKGAPRGGRMCANFFKRAREIAPVLAEGEALWEHSAPSSQDSPAPQRRPRAL